MNEMSIIELLDKHAFILITNCTIPSTGILELVDKHAPAIFGIIGALIGFMGNYFLQKWNQKFETTKDTAKEYYKKKSSVLTKALQLISDYETKFSTLHDFIEDENGMPIGEIKKEDIFAKYFELIFAYLHAHRFYLEDETIIKLDKLVDLYHEYELDIKVINAEQNDNDKHKTIATRKQKLFDETQVLFNNLKEQIKFDEMKNFKAKLENK